MKKISPNQPCPCGSQNKYKKCCARYHKGALPATALLLMKSRYVAYTIGNTEYIIKTTHETNADYMSDITLWKKSIDDFAQYTDFFGLKIIDFSEGEREAFVTFKAKLSSGELYERSRFLKVGNMWLYESATFPE